MEQPLTGDGAPPRCVLLSTQEPPAELLAALGRQGLQPVRARDPYDTLAELCRPDADPHGLRPAPSVLLLIEPAGLKHAADLVRAAAKYAPQAAVWMFEASANPGLRAVVEEDVTRWEGANTKSDNGRNLTMPEIVVRPGGGLTEFGTIARIGRGTQAVNRAETENLAPAQAKTLRLSHSSDVDRGPVRVDDDLGPSAEERSRPLLSPEELDMLLADDAGQEQA
jgi:hypothetical protein